MKSTFLKVISILLIIFGAISLIYNAMTFSVWIGSPFLIVAILSLVLAVLYLVSGFIGIPASKDQQKVSKCVILGVLMVIVMAVYIITELVTGFYEVTVLVESYVASMTDTAAAMSNPASLLLGFLFPVLYLVAAILFKRKK